MPHWLQRLYENLPWGHNNNADISRRLFFQAYLQLSEIGLPTEEKKPDAKKVTKAGKMLFFFSLCSQYCLFPYVRFCIREKKIPGGPPSVNAHTLKSPRKKIKEEYFRVFFSFSMWIPQIARRRGRKWGRERIRFGCLWWGNIFF